MLKHLLGDVVMNKLVVTAVLVLLAGCAGKVEYTPPSVSAGTNTKHVNKAKDAVWDQLVPALSKNFFVVNTIDKSSGLINISYSGNPERYVDCGEFHSYVKNARGERNYRFNAAVENVAYETFVNNALLAHQRKVSLDGRMNIVVEPAGKAESNVTVNTRYVLSITYVERDIEGHTANLSNTISFNSGGSGQGQTITCRPNGEFEKQVLELVN